MIQNQSFRGDFNSPPPDIDAQIQFINGARVLCEQNCEVSFFPNSTDMLRAIEQNLITIKLLTHNSHEKI
jgi:hypothetical protein